MGSVAGADAAVADAAGRGAAGVVSRPRLFVRLAARARVSMGSAPPGSGETVLPGSGETVLLRSWISWAGVVGSAAWVPAERCERDPQRFWLAVLGIAELVMGLSFAGIGIDFARNRELVLTTFFISCGLAGTAQAISTFHSQPWARRLGAFAKASTRTEP